MPDERYVTAAIIHGFAAAHAVTAFFLAQTMIGDEAALTFLTIAMILAITRVNGKPWFVGDGLRLIGTMAGFYLGTRGAMMLVKWIPGIGNVANAITTTAVTELLGWSTYLLVREGKKPSDLSESEAKELKERASEMRKVSREMDKIVARMSSDDKSRYDKLIKELKNRDISEKRIQEVNTELDKLNLKYK